MLLAKEENPTKIYECIIIYYSYWKSCAVCYIVEINGYCLEIGEEQIFEIERRLRRIKNVPCKRRGGAVIKGSGGLQSGAMGQPQPGGGNVRRENCRGLS